MSVSSDLVTTNPRFEVPVFHLHGALFLNASDPIVITEEDYARYQSQRRMLFNFLQIQAAQQPILYIGYSNRDPNWKNLLTELRAEFAPKSLPPSFRVAPETSAVEAEILASQGIQTIESDLRTFRLSTRISLGDMRLDPSHWQEYEETVPRDLQDAFKRSAAGVARLLNSWAYVNGEDFAAEPNLKAFLNGDTPNWALVASEIPFERDVEDPLYEELTEFATAPAVTQPVVLLTGAAGYGMTTTLMSLTARLVRENAGRLFFLRKGAALLQADIEFACSLFDEPTFFVIDNAAHVGANLPPIIQHLRETNISACFLLAERMNEWAQRRPRLRVLRMEIPPLSDAEIHRLLGLLEEHSALGILEDLPDPLRFAAIKERHQQQLLVAMKEATEGDQFDAIVENEFRGIKDEFSARLYMAVCCFYRLRSLARDNVLADLLGCDTQEMYEKSRDATEGVVIWESVDEANGIYAARARHHVIAEIVWQRVTEAGEQEFITTRALECLNLTYPIDRRAFDNFVFTDSAVDSIQSFDGKVRFFEEASRKQPRSPYVRQHFARMLRREKKYELALAEIDASLKLSPKAHILHHTRGLILGDMARAADSLDIGRKRLVQAESALREAKRLYPKGDYAYESLARLYFDWARKAENEEGATYIAKAEETISEGLRLVHEKEYLWVLSADIQEWLGDNRQARWRLEQAVTANPGGIYGRLALGRAYRKEGAPEKAISVLQRLIENHTDEYRATVEYARALHDMDRPYEEAIAVLRLGTLNGSRDPRFVAVYGGFQFLSGDFTGAEKTFEESTRQKFSLSERRRIEFAPHAPASAEPLRLQGTVTWVAAGYSFILVPEFPRIFCPGSKYQGIVMRKGTRLNFALAFSAGGPVASDPIEI
jgi:tetratricopeptide (TPR) repeat protein